MPFGAIHVKLRRMRVWASSLIIGAVLTARPAAATYSILLSNQETGELGGAAISCVGDFDLSAIFGYSKGQGRAVVFFTQGLYSEVNHDQALVWFGADRDVAEVLFDLTELTFDAYAAERQYHFLPNDGAGTTWTGAATLPYAGGLIGSFGPWRYTLAGNILTSEHVLTSAEQSLRTLAGSLEERLVVALEAGAQEGEGDSRCSPLPGDSAYIEVRNRSGVSRLRHSVVNTQPQDPLALLREAVLPGPSAQVNGNSSRDAGVDLPSRASTSALDPTTSESPRAAPQRAGCAIARSDGRGGFFACLTLLALGLRRAHSATLQNFTRQQFASKSRVTCSLQRRPAYQPRAANKEIPHV